MTDAEKDALDIQADLKRLADDEGDVLARAALNLIEALTAKLAKAVWELERLRFDFESVVGRDLMQATIAETKGT